jgi:hypothetical protein
MKSASKTAPWSDTVANAEFSFKKEPVTMCGQAPGAMRFLISSALAGTVSNNCRRDGFTSCRNEVLATLQSLIQEITKHQQVAGIEILGELVLIHSMLVEVAKEKR